MEANCIRCTKGFVQERVKRVLFTYTRSSLRSNIDASYTIGASSKQGLKSKPINQWGLACLRTMQDLQQ